MDSGVPASQWRLSHEGKLKCELLGERLRPYSPDIFISSMEPKAIETAQLTAQSLGLSWEIAHGLHEHDRSNLPLYGSQARFEAAVAEFFAQPDQLVMGRETADQAHARFDAAVRAVIAQRPEETLALVSHGTVIILFVSRLLGVDPFPFWQKLGLPAFIVLSLPELKLVEVVEKIES